MSISDFLKGVDLEDLFISLANQWNLTGDQKPLNKEEKKQYWKVHQDDLLKNFYQDVIKGGSLPNWDDLEKDDEWTEWVLKTVFLLP